MTGLLHLPMGLMWNMPVPVACSLAVAAGGLAVSCGQCPLDDAGRVLAPGDAAAQAQAVARMIAGVLSHLPAGHAPSVLVVYHDASPAQVLGPLAAAFPGAALLPVRLPHFYYPGMRIEVDLYATTHAPPLTLVPLLAPDMAAARPLLDRLDPARLLAAHWFSAAPPPPPSTRAPPRG